MKFLFKNTEPFSLGSRKYFVKVTTDGERLYATVYNQYGASGNVAGSVTYNGSSEAVSFTSSPECVVSFPYSDSQKTLGLTLNGVSESYLWRGSADDPSPSVGITYTGVRRGDNLVVSFTYSGEAENCALIAPIIDIKLPGGWTTPSYTVEKRTGASFSKLIDPLVPDGSRFKITLLFACYESPSDATEDYIGLAEYTLPELVITGAGTPLAPSGLRYSPAALAPFTVSWNAVNDPQFGNISYVLTRSVNGGDSVTVHDGVSCSYTDTLPVGADTVSYSVSSKSGGILSAEYIGDAVAVSQSNVFIGINGQPVRASGLYIGTDGAPRSASPSVIIGK